jgi:hypothetical protein
VEGGLGEGAGRIRKYDVAVQAGGVGVGGGELLTINQ